MGAKYYFQYYQHKAHDQQQELSKSKKDEEESTQFIHNALQAMEAWNKDLTWFIFWQGVTFEMNSTYSAPSDRSRWQLPEKLERFDNASNKKWKFASDGFVV